MYEFITIHNNRKDVIGNLLANCHIMLIGVCMHVTLGGRKESRIQHVHCNKKKILHFKLN